jgi:site-specific recombinase XerD
LNQKATRLVVIGDAPKAKRKSKKRRLPKILRPAEVEMLLGPDNVKRFDDIRDRVVMELMYRAGLRVSEVCKLQDRDIDLVNGELHIMDGKGGDGVAFFDTERVSPWLRRWIDVRYSGSGRAYPSPGPFLFRMDQPLTPLNTRGIQRLMERRKKKAGIEVRCTPHTLRHTYATELLRDGFDLREVQEALRHANVATTEIYTHIIDEDLRRKVNRRGQRRET